MRVQIAASKKVPIGECKVLFGLLFHGISCLMQERELTCEYIFESRQTFAPTVKPNRGKGAPFGRYFGPLNPVCVCVRGGINL